MSDLEFDTEDFSNDVGLGEEDRDKIKSNRVDWYKMDKGRTDRVAIVYFHRYDVKAVLQAKRNNASLTADQVKKVADDVRVQVATKLNKPVDKLEDIDMLDLSEVRFKTYSVSYQEGQGFGYIENRLGRDGLDADKVWKMLPEPRTTVTTLLLRYPTDQQGEIDKEKLKVAATGAGYGKAWSIIPWKFSGDDKYNKIRKLNRGLAEDGVTIAQKDLSFECKEAKFQNIDIGIAGAALWQKNDTFKRAVLTKALEFYEKLSPCRKMTTDELRVKLGMSGGGASGAVDNSAEMDALLQSV